MAQNYYRDLSTDDRYFQNRIDVPYRSTVALESFLASNGYFSGLSPGTLVLDVACGAGSETAWLALQYPLLRFLGVDLQPHFIQAASSRHGDVTNLGFVVGDIYDLSHLDEWESVKCIWLSQTLSWLPWWSEELSSLIGPQVERIAISTLAWQGRVESQVIHHLGKRGETGTQEVYYNVYSIPFMCEQMREAGFPVQAIQDFSIDIDLEPPPEPGLGNYTVRTQNGERLTFSMWQNLPWHFFMFAREELSSQPSP